MKLSPSLLALAVASSLMLSLQAHAQAGAAAAVETAGARDFDPIQVTAHRDKRTSANQNVTVLDSRMLEDEMAQSMEDIIRYVPGVSIVDLGRFGDNGFNIRGMEGDRVAMTIDGLGTAEEVDTTVAYEFFRAGRGGLDIDALKSVAIIKGADSITAGSGALGGAVAFVTKDPLDFLKAQGNDTHFGLKCGYTGATEENMATLTFANRTGIVESMLVYTRREGHEAESWYDSSPERLGSRRRLPDPIDAESDNILAKLDLVPNEAHRFGLVYERARATSDIDNLSRTDGVGAYFKRTAYDTNDRDRYGVRWLWTGGTAAFDNMEWTLDRQESESRGVTDVLVASGSVGGTPCSAATPCPRQENRWTAQVLDRTALDFDKAFNTGGVSHVLAYGLAWQRREVDYGARDYRWNNAGGLVSMDIDAAEVPQTDITNWNLYLRDRIRLLDERLTLTAGARYDRYEYSPTLAPTFVDNTGTVTDVQFSSPTWQLGADLQVAPRHSLWAQAGQGFRAPSASNMYAATGTQDLTVIDTGQVVTVPSSARNPDLESEKSLNLEAGWRWHGDTARVGVSVFRDKYDNFIESATLRVDDGVQYQSCSFSGCSINTGYHYSMPVNRGEVTVHGLEAEGQWLLGEAWSARMAFAYNKGEKGDGTPLASISPAKLVLGLRYAAPSQRWSVTGNLTHQVAKDEKDGGVSDVGFGSVMEAESDFIDKAAEYTVFDLYASINLTPQLRVNAGVYNLFDQEYYLWSRIRGLAEGTGVAWGNVHRDGIGRFSEPGRNLRLTVSYVF